MKLIILLSIALGISCYDENTFKFLSSLPTYGCPFCRPEQIHIAFGSKTNDIVVTWSTFNVTDDMKSYVKFGQVGDGLNFVQAGGYTKFVDHGRARNTQYIHRVYLNELKCNTKYEYHVGSKYGWSELFTFKTPPEGTEWVVRAAIYGDLGNTNAHALSYIQEEAQLGNFDFILHVGDFAYDFPDLGGARGDEFMRQLQPVAAYVPYMTCPGNHEAEARKDFHHYNNRFTMPTPSGTDSMFYSIDIGPIHFVSINTEVYYLFRSQNEALTQYNWLIDDLTKANSDENRSQRPWIVLFGHRPMYCSNKDDIDCSYEYTRNGFPFMGLYALEPLLMQYHVDLVVWAHEHSYERTWPLYDLKVYNGSAAEPYVNPRAPVHIVTGSAGCQEATDGFISQPQDWSAFRSSDYGYTRFWAYNKTHLYLQQVSADGAQAQRRGTILDELWIVKNKHVPFLV